VISVLMEALMEASDLRAGFVGSVAPAADLGLVVASGLISDAVALPFRGSVICASDRSVP
jgi:hypothetical protein